MTTREECEEFFRDADINNDGYLTFEETVKMLKDNGYKATEVEFRTFFEAADTSCDEKISLEEYLVVMGQLPAEMSKQAAMRRVFTSYDKDRSGAIDRKELKAIFLEMGKYLSNDEVDKLMDVVDTNKDGKLDYEEFIAFFSAMY